MAIETVSFPLIAWWFSIVMLVYQIVVYVIKFITGDNNVDGYNGIITCYDHLL